MTRGLWIRRRSNAELTVDEVAAWSSANQTTFPSSFEWIGENAATLVRARTVWLSIDWRYRCRERSDGLQPTGGVERG